MKRARDVMPCYRFKFLQYPVYYYGHALPPPLVKIIMKYGQEMTIWEDMCRLNDKLDADLKWLHEYKETLTQHLLPYHILGTRNTVPDQIAQDTKSLCHRATVDLATTLNPRPDRNRRRAVWINISNSGEPSFPGFVLPEMRNYT